MPQEGPATTTRTDACIAVRGNDGMVRRTRGRPATMATKKTTRRPRKSSSARGTTRARKPATARNFRPPTSTLQQELLQMAHGGARSLARLVGILLVIAFIAGGAAGLWLLRPVPSYSSDDVTAGSPFDVTFRVENKDAWFPLANL